MNIEFQYWQSKRDRQFYWRLRNVGNGRNIAVGGEGFADAFTLKRSIDNVLDSIAELMLGSDHGWMRRTIKYVRISDPHGSVAKGIPA